MVSLAGSLFSPQSKMMSLVNTTSLNSLLSFFAHNVSDVIISSEAYSFG